MRKLVAFEYTWRFGWFSAVQSTLRLRHLNKHRIYDQSAFFKPDANCLIGLTCRYLSEASCRIRDKAPSFR